MKRWLAIGLVLTFLTGCGSTAQTKQPTNVVNKDGNTLVQSGEDQTKTVQQMQVQSQTQSTTQVQSSTSTPSSGGVPVKTIDEVLTSSFGDRLIDKNINDLNPAKYSAGSKGINITFKYLEKDNQKVDHEVAQLIRELATTGVNIPALDIFVKSPSGGVQNVGVFQFVQVNIQDLATLDDATMLGKAKTHRVDVSVAP